MIVVIADDLTGAAELGGVAVRHGLSAEVQTAFDPGSAADVVLVDTDTRSCTNDSAAARVTVVATQVRAVAPELIFKKVDSVLRGHLVAEIQAIMKALALPRALLVPANPSLGRVIRDARYFVGGRPIDETDFALDPEFPRQSSDVLELLDSDGSLTVVMASPDGVMPREGVVVGECADSQDIASWVQRLDETILPAGAADFFAAVLRSRHGRQHVTKPPWQDGLPTLLLVSGSASGQSRSVIRKLERRGVPVIRMPEALVSAETCAPRLERQWSADVCEALEAHRVAVAAIGRPLAGTEGAPKRLLGHLVALVKGVLERHRVDHVCVEGGATASALVRHMGWRRLTVRCELAAGVASMTPEAEQRVVLTMKPGSYAWPAEVLRIAGVA